MTIRPTEWGVLHPLDGSPLAVIRVVWLGPMREPYYRVVSANPDRSQRKLAGYWSNLDEAHTAALALYEQATGRAIGAGDQKPKLRVPPQKPPPDPHEPGRAARPERHASRV